MISSDELTASCVDRFQVVKRVKAVGRVAATVGQLARYYKQSPLRFARLQAVVVCNYNQHSKLICWFVGLCLCACLFGHTKRATQGE